MSPPPTFPFLTFPFCSLSFPLSTSVQPHFFLVLLLSVCSDRCFCGCFSSFCVVLSSPLLFFTLVSFSSCSLLASGTPRFSRLCWLAFLSLRPVLSLFPRRVVARDCCPSLPVAESCPPPVVDGPNCCGQCVPVLYSIPLVLYFFSLANGAPPFPPTIPKTDKLFLSHPAILKSRRNEHGPTQDSQERALCRLYDLCYSMYRILAVSFSCMSYLSLSAAKICICALLFMFLCYFIRGILDCPIRECCCIIKCCQNFNLSLMLFNSMGFWIVFYCVCYFYP